MKKYKVALIGTGRVAEHYLSLQEMHLTNFLEYLGCYDKSNSKSSEFSKRHGIHQYNSLSDLLANEFDFALIATPSGTHFEIAMEVLKSNKNVLIEKPACLRIEQIIELENEANARKLICRSIFQNRFNMAVLQAKSILESGLIGEVTSFSLRLIWSRNQEYYDDDWHGTWFLDGGVTSQQAIHHIDCVNFLIGVPNKVHAYAQNSLNVLEAEDTLVSIVGINPSILGTYHFTTAARPCDMEASLLINGTKNSIRISGVALNNLEVFNPVSKNWDTTVVEHVESGYGTGHAKIFEYFFEGDEISTFPTMEDSKNAVMVVDALYESYESATEVYVKRQISKSKLGVRTL